MFTPIFLVHRPYLLMDNALFLLELDDRYVQWSSLLTLSINPTSIHIEILVSEPGLRVCGMFDRTGPSNVRGHIFYVGVYIYV